MACLRYLVTSLLVLLPPNSVRSEPLQLPRNPEIDCGKAVFYNFTKQYHGCSSIFHDFGDPDAECCEGLAEWFGPNSTRSSRNCFCHKPYWEAFDALSAKHYYPFETAFQMCTAMGWPVASYEEDENNMAGGFCSGIAPNVSELMNVCIANCPKNPIATLPSWFQRLPNDPLILTSLISGFISVFGFALIVLPLGVDTVAEMASYRRPT